MISSSKIWASWWWVLHLGGSQGEGPCAWIDLMVVSDSGWIVTCTLTTVECVGSTMVVLLKN